MFSRAFTFVKCLKRTKLEARQCASPIVLHHNAHTFGLNLRYASSKTIASIATCPAPTCECQEMPPGLDIDRKSPLDGTMTSYDCHVLVQTGASDWPSRIETDDRFPLVKMLKAFLGKGGKYLNPFHNVLVTTSSSSEPALILYPSLRKINNMPPTISDPETVESLIRGYFLPEELSALAKSNIPTDQHEQFMRHLASAQKIATTCAITEVEEPIILICGHGGRDERCGILGPVLKEAFRNHVATQRYPDKELPHGTSVDLISHIGGHKFAGNVILYIPRKGDRWQQHPLRGMGIWYGRVEPRHVQGIVEQTLGEGKVIRELYRGGVDGHEGLLRL